MSSFKYDFDFGPVFETVFGKLDLQSSAASNSKWRDAKSTVEGKTAVAIDLPGVEKEDIDLTVLTDNISVTAKRKEPFCYISSSTPLATKVDTDSVDAELKNGVLTVHFSLTSGKKQSKVKIK